MSATVSFGRNRSSDTEVYRERSFSRIECLCRITRATNRVSQPPVEAYAHTTDIVSRETMTGMRLLDVHGAGTVFDRVLAVLGWQP